MSQFTYDPKKRHLLITLLIFSVCAVIIGILGKGLVLSPDNATSALVGKPAHEFEAAWIHGQEFVPESTDSTLNFSDLKGRPLILNFWASWCVSCRSEAVIMEKFWRENKEDGILMVGVAIQDTEEAALEFAKYYGKTYPLALDTEGKSAIEYGVTGVPETFFIDRSGVIRHKEAGPVDRSLLDKMLPLITSSTDSAKN